MPSALSAEQTVLTLFKNFSGEWTNYIGLMSQINLSKLLKPCLNTIISSVNLLPIVDLNGLLRSFIAGSVEKESLFQ